MDQRISVHLKSPNPVFQKWISEMYESAVNKGSKSQYSLRQALDSLQRYPLVLNSGSECAILKGFGKNLCKILDKRLQNRDISKSHKSPQPGGSINKKNHVKRSAEESSRKESVKKKSKTDYVPAYRSGAYAILLTLLENYQKGVLSLSKSALQTEAQFLCDESMTKSKPGSFYTAWSSMSSLITKGYISKEKKKCVQYSLTDFGRELAVKLSQHKQNEDALNSPLCQQAYSENNYTKQINTQMKELKKTSSNINIQSEPSSSSNLKIVTTETEFHFDPGSFDIILLVDKQETSGKSKKNDATIMELEKYKMIKYELRHLKVGDFTWIARQRDTNKELILPHIVERKRMDDLGHSIKDGRFHEQKFRLKQCGIPNVIYLVESHGNNQHNIGLPLSSLKQAVANTRIQDGFMTHFTSSLAHSIKFLAMMTKLLNDKYLDKKLRGIQKGNEDTHGNNQNNLNRVFFEFNSFNSMASKTKTLTVKSLFIKQLLQLKGVSVEKAVAITSLYPTPRCLMEAFKNCRENPELLLANIKFGIKLTKIGQGISKTLHKFFTDRQLP